MSLSSLGNIAYQSMPLSVAVVKERELAIKRTRALSERAGGEKAGVSIISAAEATDEMLQLCPNSANMLTCLGQKAYEACSVRQDGPSCKQTNMLLGSAVEQAALSYLTASRKSMIDLYFLPVTHASLVRNADPDVASVAVASRTSTHTHFRV